MPSLLIPFAFLTPRHVYRVSPGGQALNISGWMSYSPWFWGERERAHLLTKCLFPPLRSTLWLSFFLRPGQEDQVVIVFDKQNFAAHLGVVLGHIAGTPCRREVGGWSSKPFSNLDPILEECSGHVPWFEPPKTQLFCLLSAVPHPQASPGHIPLALESPGLGGWEAPGTWLKLNKRNQSSLGLDWSLASLSFEQRTGAVWEGQRGESSMGVWTSAPFAGRTTPRKKETWSRSLQPWLRVRGTGETLKIRMPGPTQSYGCGTRDGGAQTLVLS